MNFPKSIDEVKFSNPSYWDVNINPLATISNGLPNCTTLVVGALKGNLPDIVSRYGNANSYHKYLINGWYCVPYEEYKNNIKVGDVIEWVNGNHIAIVSELKEEPWISGSFYTGVNGKAYYNGGFDTRDGISSLKQLSDYFANNYSYRYFHFVPLSEESKWCGSEPDYVLVSPVTIKPVNKDLSKNQAYVGTNGLRIRTAPNTDSTIRGVCPIGYFNVDEVVKGGEFDGGNIWYRVGDYFFASVLGVTYYPKQNITPLEEMMKLMKQMQDSYLEVCAERDSYKAKLDEIRGITNE